MGRVFSRVRLVGLEMQNGGDPLGWKIEETIRQPPPVALTIAGSDCSAGAGIQADLKTFSAFGVYGLTALTCAVSEVPGRVARIASMSPEFLRSQIRILAGHFPVGAVKIGMLGSAVLVEAAAEGLREARDKGWFGGPVVVDPVMVATGGDRLMPRGAVEIFVREIVPMASVLTPNLDEGEVLLGRTIERNGRGVATAASELAERLGVPVLLKGGHLGGKAADDVLARPGGDTAWFEGERVEGVTTHGTGCTLSAGIAAGLASGRKLPDAIAAAKRFATQAIAGYFRWTLANGKALDALNHFEGSPGYRRRPPKIR